MRASCVFVSATEPTERAQLDASDAEYAAAMEAANELCSGFQQLAHETEDTMQVANVDIRRVMVARALSLDDRDVNPPPGMPVPVRVMERVVRRSRRVAGLPAEEHASAAPAATTGTWRAPEHATAAQAATSGTGKARRAPADRDGVAPPAKRRRKRGSASTSAGTAGPPVFEFSRDAGGPGATSDAWLAASASSQGERAQRQLVRRKSRSKRRKKKRGEQTDEADAGPSSAVLANAEGDANQAEPETTEVEEDEDVEYRVADFDNGDLRCRPTAQQDYDPIPSGFPPVGEETEGPRAPSHHAADYSRRRAHEYRRLLAVEQLRPALLANEAGDATLAVERLNRSAPGWRGNIPRVRIQGVRKEWATPRLKELLQLLKIVRYLGKNTSIADMNGRTVLYRTTPLREHKGEDIVEEFAADSYRFAAACPITPGDRKHNPRGGHYACILGVHRQYAKEAYYTRFHRRYEEEINWYFRKGGPAARLTKYLTGIIDTRFPAIAERMRANHRWHYERTAASGKPLKPQFGLFWNFCINLPAPEHGVRRVFCEPHADAMNCAVLLCALFVFWSKDWVGEDEWSWLVVWELGVIVECPRGSFLLYPSALLFHFNARIVKCKRGQTPTPATSEELPRTGLFPVGGRGSGVWFTQASMHSHTSEKDAQGRLPDYEEVARRCFPDLKPVVVAPTVGEEVDELDDCPFLSEL